MLRAGTECPRPLGDEPGSVGAVPPGRGGWCVWWVEAIVPGGNGAGRPVHTAPQHGLSKEQGRWGEWDRGWGCSGQAQGWGPHPVKVVEGGPELIHLPLADALGVSSQDLVLHLVDGPGNGGEQLLPAHANVLGWRRDCQQRARRPGL